MTIAVGEQLAAARKARGLTQEQVATEFHVTRQTISNWEVGRSYPDIVSLIACSDYYGLSLDTLLKGDPKMVNDVEQKEAARKAARSMYFGSYAVNFALLVLVLWSSVRPADLQMSTGTRMVLTLIILLNLGVFVHATRQYDRFRKPVVPSRKRRLMMDAVAVMLCIVVAVLWVVFNGVSVKFYGVLCGLATAAGIFIWRQWKTAVTKEKSSQQ